MDSTKFEEIFSKDIYQLPIRWDGKDFYATLYKHLKEYREDIEKYCDDPDLYAAVKTVCRNICAAVDFSFRGYPEKAYKSFEGVMEILSKDPLLIDNEKINEEGLYRVVDVENAAVPNRQRVFHVPFSMRSRMSTQRYSIPGFPSLYLGTSVELCCMELGKDPQRDYVCVSRYELQIGIRIFSRFMEIDQSPVFDNDRFIIFDVSIKPDQAIEELCQDDSKNIAEFIEKYIKWYPLILACSHIRAVRDAPYSAEYIIPQLFIQWVRSENEDAVVGIKYFSCASVYASTLGYNYVFPTMGAPHHARKTITNYCPRLSHRFKLTAPRFIMEYNSIPACVKIIIKDNNLDYIEGYDAGEDEEIRGAYTIPEGVSAIGAFAFHNCNSLTSITIPDSVTSIGFGAFSGCGSLTSTIIPDSVTNISAFAFLRCSSLTNIIIPDSVTSIGDSAFLRCSSLTKIIIPSSVTSIGNAAFSNCGSLKNIAVNNSSEYYVSVDGTLYNKNRTQLVCHPAGGNQTKFVIPCDVTNIGDSAFSGCSSLTSITIPDSVTSIGDSAFSGCSSLTSIIIPSSVTNIGVYVFCDCNSLKSIIILGSVTSIGDSAFSRCKSLTSITIPDSVTSIGALAFYGCRSLTSISLPNSVTSIGNFAFSWCESLTSITVPDSVTSIGGGAFSLCESLTSITIPDNMTSIGDSAFWGCSSLTSITISDSLMSIGDSAFSGCSSLDTVYYSGTQEQAEKLEIGKSNECFQNATWVYGSSGEAS